jgi:5-formyltetrahydrofolate cyclo-ligase
MHARRRSLSQDERRRAGTSIAQVVFALTEFERADRVAAYVALEDEVPTDAILDAVLASGRTLLLPRVVASGIEFAAVGDLAQLRRGRWGVLQAPDACAASSLASGDLVLVPGLAFDRSGRRLGRGGGQYDRAFAALGTPPLRVGLAFSFQLVAVVPASRLDQSVDGVATESGYLRASPEPRDPSRDPG